jgi:hypothetical protein
MTDLLTRPSAISVEDEASPESVWWRGGLAALWACSVGVATLLVVVLIAWSADSRTGASAGQAFRAALQVWLVAHRVPLRLSTGTIAIAPLLLTALLCFLVARAAAVLARGQGVEDANGVVRVAVAVGLPYAGLTVFAAAAANSAAVHPSPMAALGFGLFFGTASAAWGAARGAGLLGVSLALMPERVRVTVTAGAAAFGVALVGATLLVVVALIAHLSTATRTADVLGGGTVAAIALIALTIALLPNAAACAIGYLAGPGFAVGAGTSISLTGAQTATLPQFPLMAAVPRGPAPAIVELAGLLILVGAGVAAAFIVARDGRPLLPSMGLALGAGAVAGLIAAVLAFLAGGPAGPGRMTALGASPWQVGLAVAAEVAVVACGAAGALTWRRGR